VPTADDGAIDGDNLLANLLEFRKFGAIKRSALLAMSLTADARELSKLSEAFAAFDKDRTGVIRVDEFAKILRKNGVKKTVEIESYFAAIDQDNSGMIKHVPLALLPN
jgi:Ca2+-binding EF-hand superfamily protein